MSPESPEQAALLHKESKLAKGVPLFSIFMPVMTLTSSPASSKEMMKIRGKEILDRYDGKSEEEKLNNPTYLMFTLCYSVVSSERLLPVIERAKEIL